MVSYFKFLTILIVKYPFPKRSIKWITEIDLKEHEAEIKLLSYFDAIMNSLFQNPQIIVPQQNFGEIV